MESVMFQRITKSKADENKTDGYTGDISQVGEMGEGRVNTSDIVAQSATTKFSVFHLPEEIDSWTALQEYVLARRAMRSPAELVVMDLEELEMQIHVRMFYSWKVGRSYPFRQARDSRYRQLAQVQALAAGHIALKDIANHNKEVTEEHLRKDYMLDRAMIVDWKRSRELSQEKSGMGREVMGWPAPWRYVLLEDIRVFDGIELGPDPDDMISHGRSHQYWKPRYRGEK